VKDVQVDPGEHVFRDVTVKRVLRDEVLARVLEEPRTVGQSGLIVASEIDRGYSQLARVERVGPLVQRVKPGEIVVLGSWKGKPFATERGRNVLIKEQFIEAKVTK
jgi:co-chaperonin GroES (HSP10)